MIFLYQKHLSLTLALACVLFVASCGENAKTLPTPPEAAKPAFSAAAYLAKDTIGFFRGAEFGDEAGTIQQMENDSFLVFTSPNALQYEYKLPGERKYNVNYTFKQNKLTTFSFDIFLKDETEAENLAAELNIWFTKKFGEGVAEMGVFVWSIKTTQYNEAYLELKDESAEFGYGKVNITAYAI